MLENIIKGFRAALAGIEVVMLKAKFESLLKKDIYWPEPENHFRIHLLASPNPVDCYERFHGAAKDIWICLAERHCRGGSPKRCLVDLWFCGGQSYEDLEKEFLFWLRNVFLIKANLSPITNPIWLMDKSEKLLKIELCPRLDEYGNLSHKLKIFSNRPINKEEIQDMIWPHYERFFSMIKIGKDWQIIRPTDETKNNSLSWEVIEII